MRRTVLAACLSIAGLATTFVTSSTAAETITVCDSGCDYTSISAAIAAAADGDIIQLAAQTYFEGHEIDPLGKQITVQGTTASDGTPTSVLDGQSTHRLIICQNGESASTTFRDLVLQYGLATSAYWPAGSDQASGGGMLNIHGSSPSLVNCVIRFCDGNYGGGVAALESSPTLQDCVIRNCSAVWPGGGMIIAFESTPTITGCRFELNDSPFTGGGVQCSSSTATFTDCDFVNNFGNYGGGVSCSEDQSRFEDCRFQNNRGKYKGGAANLSSASTTEFSHCTFADNRAFGGTSGEGGAILIFSSCSPKFFDCIFDGNTAAYGSAMYCSSPSTTLTNCVFTDCCEVFPPASFTDGGGNSYDSWCEDCRENVDCYGDVVGSSDLGLLLAAWQTDQAQFDLNGDGIVSGPDLGLLFVAWGSCP